MIARNQIHQQIVFKAKISQEYKDLVKKFLKQDPDERIPLIQVFQHPWVLYFQQKFFANWQPNDSEDEEGEGEDDESNSSSDEYYSDEDENEDGRD